MLKDFLQDLEAHADSQRAEHSLRFFKTAPGEYGEGDRFWGIRVPQIRQEVRKYSSKLCLTDVEKLLHHPIHEVRLAALLMLVRQYEKATKLEKGKIYSVYLKNKKYINNWDLVDLSAPNIVGDFVFCHPEEVSSLRQLAKSSSLWDRRIAVLATFFFIRKQEFALTLEFSQDLLEDKHDLMHKAIGWMLREVGKRDEQALLNFLKKHASRMPRTMLRYSIERLAPSDRKYWLESSRLVD